jgi:hypothetical protein
VDAYLANMLRIEGVVVALVASFLAAPAATRHMWARIKLEVGSVRRRVGSGLHRLRLWLTRRREVQLNDAATAEEALSMVPVSSSLDLSWAVNAEDDLKLRVERLEQRMGQVNERITMLQGTVRAEAAERREAIDDLARRLSDEVQSVRNKIIAAEENALRVDATALPVIGLGIVLSGIPELIARSTAWTLLVFMVALIALQRALVHFWSRAAEQ